MFITRRLEDNFSRCRAGDGDSCATVLLSEESRQGQEKEPDKDGFQKSSLSLTFQGALESEVQVRYTTDILML